MTTELITHERTIYSRELNNSRTVYIDLILECEGDKQLTALYKVCCDEKTIKTFQIGTQAINFAIMYK